MQMNFMRRARLSFSRSTAAIAEWAVASIGSQTSTSRSVTSLGREVVFDRLQSAWIAIEADMAHAGERHQVHQPFGQAEAGTQDRHDDQLLALEDRRFRRLQRHSMLLVAIGRSLVAS